MNGMHIGHVALRARDAQASATFLTEILGLRRTLQSDGQVMLSCNERHHELQFLSGAAPGLDHLGLEVEDERELEQLRDRLAGAGARILSEEPREAALRSAIRAVGPLGLVLELYTGMEREPLSVEHYMPALGRRLGHVSFAAPDCGELRAFLIEVLGFRVTDTLGDRVCWLRCDHEHHGIALVNAGTAPTLHHYAFQLESWGAIERYCDRLALLGRRLVWGPGRHGPGRNLYAYLPDPDGTIVEAYADLLEVRDESGYKPIDWSGRGEQALNLWGPLPPAGWRGYGVPILTPAA
ncbi:MAG: VOC family protein [Solirubrobacteraceae bacterium]